MAIGARRIVFMGTPAFAAVALKAILDAGHDVAAVYSQPPRPKGRGMDVQKSPVHELAEERGIAVRTPVSLKDDEAISAFQALGADFAVVAAYGLILPASILDAPRHGCLNIHASLLPRWRGAAPIQRAIEAGDRQTGITIMQMDEGLDTGRMLLSQAVPIDDADTSGSLQSRLAELGGRLVVRALAALEAGTLVGQSQPAEGVTYAAKIAKAEAPIDWRLPAVVIERRLRAFDPFPGASATLGGETLKCWRGRVAPSGTGAPGEVLAVEASGLRVACGEGALDLTELQRAGGRRLPVREFLQRDRIEPGMRFELSAAAMAPREAGSSELPPATL